MVQVKDRGSIFITGANGGIGSDCVRRFAKMGYTVFAGVRDMEQGNRLKETIAGSVVPIEIDITVPSSVMLAAQKVAAALGKEGLSGLVNNAGCIVQGPLELLTLEEIKQQFDINVFGQVAVTQAFLPLIRRKSGRIVNVGAVTGKTAMPFLGALSASKHAMEAITDALRMELKPWNIHVAIIEPTAIQTRIFDKANAASDLSLKQVPADKRGLYVQAVTAIHAAMAKQPISPTEVVVEAIIDALTSEKPRTRYAVGKGARMVVTLSHLPDKLRDRLLSSSLGLSKVTLQKR
ncbi:SDR family oxidoreductase [Paenibacillus sp. SI8]|uniref:SDR family oxidoreductase n=1 Tax=unclassified Paenibacillus TaxID=185978 RepID=UPI0034672FE0